LRGQWNVAFLRADLAGARQAAESLLAQAQSRMESRMRDDAHTKLGQTCLHQGDLQAARFHLEAALAAAKSCGDDTALRGAPRVAAYLAWALWYGGHPVQAADMGERALDLARRAGSPHSTAFALGYVSWVRLMRGEIEPAQALVVQQRALSLEYGLAYWRQLADFIGGAVMARQGALAEGINFMRRAIEEMQASGGNVGVPYLFCILAEAQLAAGRLGEGRTSVGAAAALIDHNGNALYAAEVLRLEGLVAQREDDSAAGRKAAGRHFEAALETARLQGAYALELRAARCLARLAATDGDLRRAVDALAPVRDRFGEGFETEDLARADELLSTWHATLLLAPMAAGASR
jgi:hypothetical protein